MNLSIKKRISLPSKAHRVCATQYYSNYTFEKAEVLNDVRVPYVVPMISYGSELWMSNKGDLKIIKSGAYTWILNSIN